MSSPLFPRTDAALMAFLKSKATPWGANHAAIGTTSAAVTAMNAKVATAEAKLQAAVDLHQSAKAATADARLAVDAARRSGADIVKQVRAKAATDGPSVYVLAEIPAPPTPGPVGNPGTPTNFKVALNGDGSIRATWKCANPPGSTGTMYLINRRVAGGEWAQLGGSGTKSFVDATLPAGAASVTYQIQAVRSTAVGAAAQFVVNFGVSGGTMTAAVVSQGGAPKLAA
ncbi:MAG TPA: fibronectin type III domain-containing protein [Tepidisphaeraceae bacterium]|nr:fibronectin type III domain-containing protein [Tepidisphaeraceae bacterium]